MAQCSRLVRHGAASSAVSSSLFQVSSSALAAPLPASSVRIDVSHASINPLDVMMTQGYGSTILSSLNGVLGRDGLGHIQQVGSAVWNSREGDRIWFSIDPFHSGAFANIIDAKHYEIALAPRTLSDRACAGLPFAITTAWTALVSTAGLRPVEMNASHLPAFKRQTSMTQDPLGAFLSCVTAAPSRFQSHAASAISNLQSLSSSLSSSSSRASSFNNNNQLPFPMPAQLAPFAPYVQPTVDAIQRGVASIPALESAATQAVANMRRLFRLDSPSDSASGTSTADIPTSSSTSFPSSSESSSTSSTSSSSTTSTTYSHSSDRSKRILIHGGSGAIGTVACHLLKKWGHQVWATCSTPHVERLRSIGVDYIIDYTSSLPLSRSLSSNTVDIILDCVGTAESEKEAAALCPRHYLTLRSPFISLIDQDGIAAGTVKALSQLSAKKAQWLAQSGSRYDWILNRPNSFALQYLSQLIDMDRTHLGHQPNQHEDRWILVSPRIFNGLQSIPDAIENAGASSRKGKHIVNINSVQDEQSAPSS